MSEEMSNATDDREFWDLIEFLHKIDRLPKKMPIAFLVICSLVFVLGFLGNGLVIFITSFRMKKTVNTVWFLNLAIADIIFILSLVFVFCTPLFEWYNNQFMCKMRTTLISLNFYASVYILTVISIDRCIYIRHPIWAQNHRKPQLASFVALGVWILALVLSSPPLYFVETITNPFNNNTACYYAYGNTIDTQMSRRRDVIISRFIFAFVIPFTVIFLCYGAIVLKLRSKLFQASKPYKIMTALIVTFFVCWFPYHVFSVIKLKYSSCQDKLLTLIMVEPIALCLAFINSCVNPILYVFMARGFKDSLKWPLFSAFENAFTEEVRQTSTTNKTKSSAEVESQL